MSAHSTPPISYLPDYKTSKQSFEILNFILYWVEVVWLMIFKPSLSIAVPNSNNTLSRF